MLQDVFESEEFAAAPVLTPAAGEPLLAGLFTVGA